MGILVFKSVSREFPWERDSPSGPVVKASLSSAGGTGLIPWLEI